MTKEQRAFVEQCERKICDAVAKAEQEATTLFVGRRVVLKHGQYRGYWATTRKVAVKHGRIWLEVSGLVRKDARRGVLFAPCTIDTQSYPLYYFDFQD